MARSRHLSLRVLLEGKYLLQSLIPHLVEHCLFQRRRELDGHLVVLVLQGEVDLVSDQSLNYRVAQIYPRIPALALVSVDAQHHWLLGGVAGDDGAPAVADARLQVVVEGVAGDLQHAPLQVLFTKAGLEDVHALVERLAGIAANLHYLEEVHHVLALHSHLRVCAEFQRSLEVEERDVLLDGALGVGLSVAERVVLEEVEGRAPVEQLGRLDAALVYADHEGEGGALLLPLLQVDAVGAGDDNSGREREGSAKTYHFHLALLVSPLPAQHPSVAVEKV
jgi:hypothetical protein